MNTPDTQTKTFKYETSERSLTLQLHAIDAAVDPPEKLFLLMVEDAAQNLKITGTLQASVLHHSIPATYLRSHKI